MRAIRVLLPLLLLCGTAPPLQGQVARMQASATVVAPVQATVDPQVRVERRADGGVQVEVGVNVRGASSWLVAEQDPASAAGPRAAAIPGCGGWTGAAPAPAERQAGPDGAPRRLTATVRCGRPADGAVHPRPLVVLVTAIN